MLKFKSIVITLLLLITALVSNAQKDNFSSAYRCITNGKIDSAKYFIDLSINEPNSKQDGLVWYLRGYIYYELHKLYEKDNPKSQLREEGLYAAKKSFELDTTKDNKESNIKIITYFATTLYNDAVSNMDSINYKVALASFEKFKEVYFIVDTSKDNFKQTETKFLLALASVYTQYYEGDKKNRLDFLNLAKNTYNKVLSLEPNNFSANYNMGILYYNQAVSLINQQDFEIDIIALNDIQDNSINLFKESLPFMEKAYNLNPKRRETLLGLSGIYFSLNEFEKSNIFKQKLLELEKQK